MDRDIEMYNHGDVDRYRGRYRYKYRYIYVDRSRYVYSDSYILHVGIER